MNNKIEFKNLGRRKAYEEVENQIREQILGERLNRDERLPSERDLAQQFGVSRVVIREAIRTLELAGFVTVKKGAGGGIFVAKDYDRPIINSIANFIVGEKVTLENLFEVRAIIEPNAGAKLSESGTEEEFDQLSNFIKEAEEQSVKGTNIRPYNIQFHRFILRMSRNPVLSVLGEAVLSILSEYIKDLVSPETSCEVLKKHKGILGAIIQRQADVTRHLMVKEIHSLGNRFAKLGEQLRQGQIQKVNNKNQ